MKILTKLEKLTFERRAVNFQKIILKVKQHEIKMNFAMNIDKLNLANLVGEVMDKIVEFLIFFKSRNLYKKVKLHGFWL